MFKIHSMDIHSVDLNLLLVFDAMYRHRNVTRAGEDMGLSQPAMSAALARLRVVLADPLFVRSGPEMRPTPRADSLKDTVRQIVQLIESRVLQPTAFAPQTSQRSFTLLAPDIAEMNFLPRLLQHLALVAPGVSLKTLAMPRHMAASALESGAAEMAIGYFPDLQKAGFYRQRLIRSGHVCLLRKQHPSIRNKISLKQFLQASHAVVKPDGREHVFELFLKEKQLIRRVAVELSHFMSLLPIVENSDLIATVPRDLAEFFVHHGQVRYVDTPIKSPIIDVHLFWHQQYAKDPAHVWLRRSIFELFGGG
jgi:DNA-binding transcriptional LysR family regulator